MKDLKKMLILQFIQFSTTVLFFLQGDNNNLHL